MHHINMFTTGNTHLKYRKHRVHSAAHKLKIRSSRLVLTTAGTDLDSTDRAAIGGAKNSSASEPLKRPILSLWNSRVHKVRNNNSPNYLAQLFISHQSHYTNSRNNLYMPRPRLDLFKTSISFAGASLWNSLPQNIKSCISLPCFKCNLHKYTSENNNLSSNLDRLV